MRKKVQVAVFYQDELKQILLLMMQLIPKRGSHWQNITGHVDDGEDFKCAAQRELQEETGLKPHNIELIKLDYEFKFHDQYGHDCIEQTYFAISQSQEIIIDPKEHTQYKWVNINQIQESDFGYISNWKVVQQAVSQIEQKRSNYEA